MVSLCILVFQQGTGSNLLISWNSRHMLHEMYEFIELCVCVCVCVCLYKNMWSMCVYVHAHTVCVNVCECMSIHTYVQFLQHQEPGYVLVFRILTIFKHVKSNVLIIIITNARFLSAH